MTWGTRAAGICVDFRDPGPAASTQDGTDRLRSLDPVGSRPEFTGPSARHTDRPLSS